MKLPRLALCSSILLGAVACEDDPGATLAPEPPIAYVRYVHVVPDTSATDWRPIDAVVNSPEGLGLTFRANTPYRAMGTGARKLRVFPTSTNINITSQHLIDTTITFTANSYYTLIHIGLARPGQAPADRLWLVEDQIPANIGAQVALRVINAAVGLGAMDVTTAASTTGAASPLFSNVAYGTASTYQLVATGARALQALATGTTTPTLANIAVPPGAAADPGAGLSTIGGSNFAGSAITAIVVPRSVAGTAAPQTFTTPSIVYLIDRHPR
jgi:hypothetical protein